jgi:DNA gyrase subunit A
VRRNKLSDFVQVNRNGKIAMKLEEEGDEILGVETCTDDDDVLLTASSGQCIRFRVSDVRVFQSRNSVGVRGISMADTDRVISMSVIAHVDADASERAAYLKRAVAGRRLLTGAPSGLGAVALGGEWLQRQLATVCASFNFCRSQFLNHQVERLGSR